MRKPTNTGCRSGTWAGASTASATWADSPAPGATCVLAIGILDEHSDQAKVKLAIAGVDPEGWYKMGTVQVQK
jgi:hypothetical protein